MNLSENIFILGSTAEANFCRESIRIESAIAMLIPNAKWRLHGPVNKAG